MNIIGRSKEQALFDQLISSETAELIALYGRRRVGKTYLIQQYFQDKGCYFELTGRHKAARKIQLHNFSMGCMKVFNTSFESEPETWDEAFERLQDGLEKRNSSEKIILFFDELPWLASRKSGFLEALDYFWNHYASRNSKLILIVCGSAAAWMIKKIIANRGGLHNRLTRPAIRLLPFTLKETEEYLKTRHIVLDRKQLIHLYMALGGVAYYLNFVPQGKSTAEIMQELFFVPNAPLQMEFHHLFASLFQNYKKHVAIIKLLAASHQGLTLDEIIKKIKTLSSGGGLATILEELEYCGFILKLRQFGKRKKELRYRLIDAYVLFFLKWVGEADEVGEGYWLQKTRSVEYSSWAGYAFENVCFQHYREIIEGLKLSVVAETKSSWIFKGNEDEPGAQIDLIIDRADKCINLCEIKFCDDEFVIDKTYAAILRRKKSVFRLKTKTRKSVFLTMITPYGVMKNMQYLELVDGQLTMDNLFE